MAERGFRFEVTLSELIYRGDRDERLVEFTVAGEGPTSRNAILAAFSKMECLGHEATLAPEVPEEGAF